MADIAEILARVRRLDKTATLKPWRRCGGCECSFVWSEGADALVSVGRMEDMPPPPDAEVRANSELIAAYRQDAPALAEEVGRLEAEVHALRKERGRLQARIDELTDAVGRYGGAELAMRLQKTDLLLALSRLVATVRWVSESRPDITAALEINLAWIRAVELLEAHDPKEAPCSPAT